jgi:hypothetical protein
VQCNGRGPVCLPDRSRCSRTGLSPTDLQSLLLDLSRTRAHRTTPASVRRRWQQDRFVQPSAISPRRLTEVLMDLTVIDATLGDRIRDTVQPHFRRCTFETLRDDPGHPQLLPIRRIQDHDLFRPRPRIRTRRWRLHHLDGHSHSQCQRAMLDLLRLSRTSGTTRDARSPKLSADGGPPRLKAARTVMRRL